MRNAAAAIVVLLMALAQAPAVWAHAALVRAEPADGAVVAVAPATLMLTFNEPVVPLVMRLIGPGGELFAPPARARDTTVTITPPPLGQGTHVLSWRVVSADGHPIGGSLTFSVGKASARLAPEAAVTGDPDVWAVLWMAKVVIYAALMIGVGGAFFRAWLAPNGPGWLTRSLIGLLTAGLVAVVLSVGLQGLDALMLPLSGLRQGIAWQTGQDTSYGLTAIVAAAGLLAALASFATSSRGAIRGLSLAGLSGGGLALALSGHASNAMPQFVTRPSVFLHVVCIAFWIGALLPMLAAVRRDGRGVLARFARAIPYPLAALIGTGIILAIVQLDRIDAIWTTSYGIVLTCKLVAVAALLALAAANRCILVPRYQAGGEAAARPLARSIAIEFGIALSIFGLVALWRFTPPPRSFTTSAPVSFNLYGQRAVAEATFEAVRGQGATLRLRIVDRVLLPLSVKEVAVVLANSAAGIEPLRREAIGEGAGAWRVENLHVPVDGPWRLRIELLVSDFDRLVLEDDVTLPRTP
ncbi:MAG: copper resistance CopC/CopD family protein [Xanthobacteraceae bacterium]